MNPMKTTDSAPRSIERQKGIFILSAMAVFLFSLSLFALYMTERMGKSFSTQKRRSERTLVQSINTMMVDGIDCCQTLEFAQTLIDDNVSATGFPCQPLGDSTTNPLMNDAGVHINSTLETAIPGNWYRSIPPLYADGQTVLDFSATPTLDSFAGYHLELEANDVPLGVNADLSCQEVTADDGTPLLDSIGEPVVALMMSTYTKNDNRERAIDSRLPKLFQEREAIAACWPIFKCGWTAKCAAGSSYKGDNTSLRDLRTNPDYVLNPCFDDALTIFVSSTETDGSIQHTGPGGTTTGIEAADAICQEEGDLVQANGVWFALISTPLVRAKDRVNIATTVNNASSLGTSQVAGSFKDFWQGGMATSISYLADGSPLTPVNDAATHVWTGSSADSDSTLENCNGWTSTTGNGTYGNHTASGNTDWLSAGNASCGLNKRIYCIGFH